MSDMENLRVGDEVEFQYCRQPEMWHRAVVVAVWPVARMVTIRSLASGRESDRLPCNLRRVAEPRPEAVRAEPGAA